MRRSSLQLLKERRRKAMPNHTDVGISQANDLLYTNLMQNPHDPDVRLSHFCNRQGSYVVYHRRHVQLICCNLPSEVKWIFKGSGEFLLCVTYREGGRSLSIRLA